MQWTHAESNHISSPHALHPRFQTACGEDNSTKMKEDKLHCKGCAKNSRPINTVHFSIPNAGYQLREFSQRSQAIMMTPQSHRDGLHVIMTSSTVTASSALFALSMPCSRMLGRLPYPRQKIQTIHLFCICKHASYRGFIGLNLKQRDIIKD
jgi:hypothetical protein